MRRFTLLALLSGMLSMQMLSAQTADYYPIFTPNTHWDLSVIDFGTGNLLPTSQATIKDTLMSGQKYMVFAEDSRANSRNIFVREDKPTKKIHIIDIDGKSKVLYDFNLQKGDIFEFDTAQFKVVNVDKAITGEGQRTRIELKCTSKIADNLVWIEGVGSTISPLYHRHYASNVSDVKVSCFFRESALVYSLSDFPCSLPLSSKDINPSRLGIMISPNPFVDNLHIELANPLHEEGSLRIFSVPGRLIYEEKLLDKESESSLNMGFGGLAAGVYFVEFKTSNSTVYQRIIKR